MDRDNRWKRTIEAYEAIAFAKAPCHDNAVSLIENNYQNNITDEFIRPAVIGDYQGIKPEDGVLLANFRADRMIQLASILLGKTDYAKVAKFSSILSMMKYKEDLKIPYIFPPTSFADTLGQTIEDNKLRQLRIAETEKYAHVTFFSIVEKKNLSLVKKEYSFPHQKFKLTICSPKCQPSSSQKSL